MKPKNPKLRTHSHFRSNLISSQNYGFWWNLIHNTYKPTCMQGIEQSHTPEISKTTQHNISSTSNLEFAVKKKEEQHSTEVVRERNKEKSLTWTWVIPRWSGGCVKWVREWREVCEWECGRERGERGREIRLGVGEERREGRNRHEEERRGPKCVF